VRVHAEPFSDLALEQLELVPALPQILSKGNGGIRKRFGFLPFQYDPAQWQDGNASRE
jgi:hypothetical protein